MARILSKMLEGSRWRDLAGFFSSVGAAFLRLLMVLVVVFELSLGWSSGLDGGTSGRSMALGGDNVVLLGGLPSGHPRL